MSASLGIISLGLVLLPASDAADLFTTNREALASFWAAAEAKNRPVTIVSFGDSMAEAIRTPSYYLMQKFEARLGAAGCSLNSYRNRTMYNFTNGASLAGPSARWFMDHYVLPPGAAVWFETQNAPGGVLSDAAGIFYLSQPAGGPLTLSVSTNGGPWETKLWLDGYSATPQGHFTNVNLARNFHRLRVDSVSGTNYLLGPQLLAQTNGIHVVFMDRYGIGLDQVTNVARAIRDPVFAALQPDLVIWHMKEDGSLATSNRLMECEDWWRATAPAAAVLYIGTTWIASDSTTPLTPLQNELVRAVAVEQQRGYVDLMLASGSYEWLATNFYMLGDGVHPSVAGAQWGANVIWNDLNFYALGLPRSLSLNLTGGLARVSFNTAAGASYQLQEASNHLDWNALMTFSGNGLLISTNLPAGNARQFYRLQLAPE